MINSSFVFWVGTRKLNYWMKMFEFECRCLIKVYKCLLYSLDNIYWLSNCSPLSVTQQYLFIKFTRSSDILPSIGNEKLMNRIWTQHILNSRANFLGCWFSSIHWSYTYVPDLFTSWLTFIYVNLTQDLFRTIFDTGIGSLCLITYLIFFLIFMYCVEKRWLV